VLPKQGENSLEHLRTAELAFDGKEADFANFASGREMGIKVFELLIERERAVAANSEHAGKLTAAEAAQVSVFGVEFVHQAVRGGGVVLLDFLHESFVIEPVNLLEFPVLTRGFENQWWS